MSVAGFNPAGAVPYKAGPYKAVNMDVFQSPVKRTNVMMGFTIPASLNQKEDTCQPLSRPTNAAR